MSEEYKQRTREMIAVMQAFVDGEQIEVTHSGGSSWEIMSIDPPSWSWFHMDYRIATTPDSIDWSHVAPRFKYMARDKNGECYLFAGRPNCDAHGWVYGGGALLAQVLGFSSYRRGTADWKDSLVARPEP